MSIVTLKHLTKCYQDNIALQDLSFAIDSGAITGIIGADGAGKTTLLRILSGLLSFQADMAQILGFSLEKNPNEIQENIGYMPQKFGLYEDQSVLENLKLYANLQSIAKHEQQHRIDTLLAFTKLDRFQNFLAANLSGGMKQKLGLACSLIKKPKLLLLDEPTVGVDPISRKELWSMVESLKSEGISILWSTAYLDEAELCDSVLLLDSGKLLFEGTPDTLKSRVKERTFKISGHILDKRKTLSMLLQTSSIKDALIQSDSIKILTDTSKEIPSLASIGAKDAIITEVSPTFEDGFMDILGANFDKSSPLEEFFAPIECDSTQTIHITDLTKKFGSFTAVDSVSFAIKKGEIFGLLGPNGAGKSTIFKMLCALVKPTSGQAKILGYDVATSSLDVRAKIGYMSQKFSLYGDISVAENLNFFAGVYGLYGTHKSQIIQHMIEIFDLNSYLHTPSKELPLGYKQRLSLACAIMHNPTILFLDEPTSGVDPLTRREFWNHIYAMVQKGVTVMVTTHFMEEAQYCDNIALIYKSKAIAIDTPHNLTNQIGPNATMQEAFIELIKRSDNEDS
jgi:ABC-2 type transport system ATP-binding protein